MIRASRGIFIKNLHNKTYANPFEAFLFSMGSTRQLWVNMSRINSSSSETKYEVARMRNRYRVMLAKLKNDGLIKYDKSLTLKGIRFLKYFLKKEKDRLPQSVYTYHRHVSFIIVVFDIPERLKRYRGWLRRALQHIGFTMLQKSVWVGKIKLPIQFLEDIRNIQLIEYIQIFEISKKGTMEDIASSHE